MGKFEFIFPEHSKFYMDTKYTWNHEWIWPYESPWGVIEKFKFANAAQDKDILEVLGTTDIRNKTKKFYTYQDRNLVSLQGFDESKLVQVLGINIKRDFKNNLDTLIRIMPRFEKEDFYFRKNISFCPECIKYGYHSIFHQIAFIIECPFHGAELVYECPECKRNIIYQLSDKYTSSPFVCLCGYSYIDIGLFMQHVRSWTKVLEFKIITSKISQWLGKNKEYKSKSRSFFFKSIAKAHFGNLIDYFSSVLEEKVISSTIGSSHVIIEQGKESSHLFINKTKKQLSVENFQIEVYKAYISVFRSIARFIRKKLLKGHKSCIRSLSSRYYTIDSANLNICPYAYSYIMWRKEIEGYKKFTGVQSHQKPKLKYNETKLGRHVICYSNELQELLYEWIKHPKTTAFSVDNMFRWIFNRVIGFLLYNRFINYLKVAENCIKADLFEVESSVINEKIPFFMIVYPNEQDRTAKIHYWLNNGDAFSMVSAQQVCLNEIKVKI